MSYLKTYSSNQIRLVNTLIDEMNRSGIENPYLQSAILSVISKESNFSRLREICYNNTSNARIKLLFSKARNLTDLQLNELKKDCTKFFNYIYGGIIGNNNIGDGFKYLGRGYNGITGKNNYDKIGKQIGIDLINNPQLLETPSIAAKAMVQYFKNEINSGRKLGIYLRRYGVENPHQVKDSITAAKMMFNANAGLGNDTRSSYWTNLDGYKKTMERLNEFNSYAIAYNKNKGSVNMASGILIFLLASGYFLSQMIK